MKMKLSNNLLASACLFATLLGQSIVFGLEHDRVLNDEQVELFHTEGYIKVSGLFDDEMVHDLAMAAKQTISSSPRFPFFYSVSQTGLLFGSTSEGKHNHTTTQTFRKTALYSKIPQVVAELMKLDPEVHNLRVLRDVFLAISVEDSESCDWHVDDLGFWPESYLSEEGMEGINVWIALDDMPSAYQGSMAVAPGSHKAEWRHRAYEALGQNRTQDGGRSKEEVILKIQNQKSSDQPKSKYPTCDMGMVDSEVRGMVDSSKKVLDYKRGDVIFATRLLFHRTLPVTEEGIEFYGEHGVEHLSRYSIRYVPGTARLPSGWSVEWSIVDNGQNAGKTLDGVVDQSERLYYPQVWPTFDSNALQTDLEKMATVLPDLAKKAQSEFMSTIFGNNHQSS